MGGRGRLAAAARMLHGMRRLRGTAARRPTAARHLAPCARDTPPVHLLPACRGRDGWACPPAVLELTPDCTISGDDILNQLGFGGNHIWEAFVGLLGLTVSVAWGGHGAKRQPDGHVLHRMRRAHVPRLRWSADCVCTPVRPSHHAHRGLPPINPPPCPGCSLASTPWAMSFCASPSPSSCRWRKRLSPPRRALDAQWTRGGGAAAAAAAGAHVDTGTKRAGGRRQAARSGGSAQPRPPLALLRTLSHVHLQLTSRHFVDACQPLATPPLKSCTRHDLFLRLPISSFYASSCSLKRAVPLAASSFRNHIMLFPNADAAVPPSFKAKHRGFDSCAVRLTRTSEWHAMCAASFVGPRQHEPAGRKVHTREGGVQKTGPAGRDPGKATAA